MADKLAEEFKAQLANNPNAFITDDEVRRLILALGYTRIDTNFTEAEVAKLIMWVKRFRLDTVLFEMLMAGAIGVDVKNDKCENAADFEDISFHKIPEESSETYREFLDNSPVVNKPKKKRTKV